MLMLPLKPLYAALLLSVAADFLALFALCVLARPLKLEPRTRFTVLPLTLDTSLSCAPGICFCSVFASGISLADPYSISVLLETLALPVPATLKPLALSWLAVVAARPGVFVALNTWTCTLFVLTVCTCGDFAALASLRATRSRWLSRATARNNGFASCVFSSTWLPGLGG